MNLTSIIVAAVRRFLLGAPPAANTARRGFLALAGASLVSGLLPLPTQAAALSDYLENKLIDHVFRGTSYTAPGTIYVALFTSSCSDSAGGTEVSGGSYARPSITSNGTNWANTQSSGTGVSSGTGGTTSNSNAINFATPSAGWGTVTYWGLYDASTSGNLLICAALTTSKTINNGDSVSFAGGALTVQIDN
jgi:hypothetical protein